MFLRSRQSRRHRFTRHSAMRRAGNRRTLRLEKLEDRRLLAADVLFRINVGGPQLTGTPNWEADTTASPSPYNNAPTGNSATATVSQSISTTHPSVPAGTPMELFQSERFDKPGPPNLEWNFPVSPGEYEVRLYFAETWSGAFSPGVRKFDVAIEGAVVLNNYDIFADVGALTGVVKSFTVSSDANLDIDFLRVMQNPTLSGIEILTVDQQQSGSLAASPGSLNFGTVLVGQSQQLEVTLTNNAPPGSPSVTINPAQASITPTGSPFGVSFQQSTSFSLAPGQSTLATITYAPTAAANHSATLNIPHSGDNSPLTISLNGTAATQIPISFGKSTLGNTTGLNRPTSLQFGPDGRLYVSQQDGLIRAYTVARNGVNDYDVVTQETISLIQQIPNHNDDGSLNSTVNTRLVTGLLVTGTSQNPVLYVTSSDPRIGGGSSGTDLNLDTNSSMVSRLTWTGTTWQRLDLVRGLPRSEENHAANGMQLDPVTNTLYVAMGGNTNMGAPSNNFSFLPEYALSAAILAIDLDAIGNSTYDLPTLNDENRAGTSDANDPFGGNDGKNQAKLVPGGPVQVFAPGFRNPYDLLINSAGRMYTVDNGPNAGWGDIPVNEGPQGLATNAPNEPGVTFGDGLHFITGAGYYGGHPNPTRSNPANTFNTTNPQSPVSTASPMESDYLVPGVENGALVVFGDSTNGIAEYTAGNFGGAMQGDLIIASFDNTIKRVKLNAAGDQAVLSQNLFSSVGFRPLDVTAPATGPFVGSIWVADIALGTVIVFEPADQSSGDPDDFDGDGYSNDDEIANDTDPHNAADMPPDYDEDFLSNLLDNDDDNDTLSDNSDRFAVDAQNGATTSIGTFYSWENEGNNEGGILGLGFTGLMTNGVDDYEGLFDPQAVTAGGAAGVFTIDSATSGTARGSVNTQEQAFQFGVHVASETAPFTAKSSVLAPFSGLTPQPGQEMGMFIGTGDQDNYIQIVVSGNDDGSIQLMQEFNGVFSSVASNNLPLPGPGFVELHLTIDPLSQTAQASYIVDGNAPISLGSAISIPAAWLSGTLAVGLISTDPTASDAMPVTWDFLGVVSASTGDPEAFLLIDPQGGLLTSSTFADNSFKIVNNSTGNVRIQSVTIDARTALLPDLVFDPTGEGGNDLPKPFTPNSGAAETGLLGHALLNPHDEGFDVLEIQFGDFDPGEEFIFSIDMEPTSIKGSVAPGPGQAGKISGLELTGSSIAVVFSDGTTTHTQTFRTPGSGRASQTTTDSNLPPAPGLSLVGTTTPPATVTNPDQTLRLTGAVGANVRLIQVEAALYTQGVPGGGFDIDPFEANKAIKLTEQAVTIGPSGFLDVPVTLTKTAPEGGYNYFVAAISDAAGRTGAVSQEVILQLQEEGASGTAGRVNIYPNGSLNNSSTFTTGSFHIMNQSTSGEQITSATIDLRTSLLTDIVFDPNGTAGDPVGKTVTPDSGASATGFAGHTFGSPHDGGFDTVTINFNDFDPGEAFTFSVDVDPTSIKGAAQPGPQHSGSVSGLETTGAVITLQFSDGTTHSGEVFAAPGSKVNAHAILDSATPPAPSLAMIGVPTTPTILSNPSQTVRISGPAGATARLMQTENALFLGGVPGGGFDIDPFETNKVIVVKHSTVTIGSSGFVDVPVVLTDNHERAGVNSFAAVIQDAGGRTSVVSDFIVVALHDDPATCPHDYTGMLAGDYDGSGTVDNWDYMKWKSTFGDEGDGLLTDGNANGWVDAADYAIWQDNLGATISSGSFGGEALGAQVQAITSPLLAEDPSATFSGNATAPTSTPTQTTQSEGLASTALADSRFAHFALSQPQIRPPVALNRVSGHQQIFHQALKDLDLLNASVSWNRTQESKDAATPARQAASNSSRGESESTPAPESFDTALESYDAGIELDFLEA